MSDYKLVPVEPTDEMVEAAEDAYMPFGDMEMAIRMAILAAPAVQGESMLNGFRVMSLTGRPGARVGERWEVYAPCGSGGVVHEDEVADWVVRKLLDSLATQNLEDQREPVGFIRHVHYHGIARNSEECEAVLYDNAKNLPEGTQLYTTPPPAKQQPDVAQLVEALSGLLRSHCIHEGEDVVGRVKGTWSVEAEEAARAALAAHLKGGE